MRQTMQREVLKRHFVPNTAGGTRAHAPDSFHAPDNMARAAEHREPYRPAATRMLGRTMLRTGSTVFWAILSEKVYAKAISQRRASSALLGGSLAAGAGYMQDRALDRDAPVAGRRTSRPSLFSFHLLMGLGLGLGAMLANRRR